MIGPDAPVLELANLSKTYGAWLAAPVGATFAAFGRQDINYSHSLIGRRS